MRRRFFRAATLSIIVGLMTAFIFAVPLMEQLYTDETEQRLTAALTLVSGYELSAADDDPYQSLAEEASSRLSEVWQAVRITLIRADGTVLGDSEANPAQMENHAGRSEVIDALSLGQGKDIRRSATTGNREMYYAIAKAMADGSLLVFRASIVLNGFHQAFYMLWGCALIGIFIGFLVALVAAKYAAGRVLKPLQDLTQAARQIASDTAPVHVEDAPDEMGELSGAFNRMSERLAAAHTELRQNNQRMQSVLQGMDDGVVALDAGGAITLLTRRARELLGPAPEYAARLTDCGANYLYLQNLIDKVMTEGTPLRDTIVLVGTPERIVQIYVARVSQSEDGGALAVLSDVTRIHKLETMRSEFVANVTHELKTPLTSIRGYIELLKSGPRDEKTAQSFYDIIEIEAERLQKLKDDILQLSEIESGTRDNEAETASVLQTVDKIMETLRPVADEKSVSFDISVPPELCVGAGPHRFYQLMKNLMENAVKYNRDGGSVSVSAGVERGVVVIRVHDTGIGIPKEHIERVFERFYRVDKGRSREQGGTGLGLSIVKHIVNLYGGDIRVESDPDVGTTFIVRLKRG